MNLNIVCDYASIYSGNFIPSVLFFANSIKQSNKIVFSFPNDAKERKWIHDIKKSGFNIYFFSREKRRFSKDLRAICRQEEINFVYFHFVSPALGKTVFLFRNIKLCFHIHSDFSSGRKVPLFRRIKDGFFDKCIKTNSIYIYVSKDLCIKSKAKYKYHVPNGLVADRHNLVSSHSDTKQFDQISNSLAKLNHPVFLAFAWSPFVKGIDVLVSAFNELLKTSNASLVLVHGKDDGKNKLIDFLHSNNLFDFNNILFVPPIEDVAAYYNNCSFFVSSSRSEGFSYSLLEAISYNKTVIVSDIPGTSWSNDFRSVIQFRSNDSDSLKNAMMTAINSKISDEDILYNRTLLRGYSIEQWNSNILECLSNQGIKL